MRLTGLAVGLFAAGVPLSLALILVNERLWPLALAYLVAVTFLAGIDGLRCLPPRALTVAVDPPAMLFIGDREALTITVSAATPWPGTIIEGVCDVGPNLEILPQLTGTFPPTLHLSLPLIPKRRGTATVDRLWLRWHGPMRLVRRQRVDTLSLEIPVVPNTRAVRQAAIRFASRDALFGFKPERQQGDGSDFECLRDYVPGLDHRSIDWKHSARHRKLVCKEFRAERNHQIILAFDTGHLMSEPLDGVPRLDHAINAGLLLGYMSLRGGDRIGVFGFDSQVRFSMAPVGGLGHFGRLQHASAELEYRHEETNFTLGLVELLARLRRRSLIILQTEFVDTITAELMVENVARLAARHLVIFVALQDSDLGDTAGAAPDTLRDMTKAVIADDLIRERMVVFEKLRRLGVHCLHAHSRDIGVDLVNRYLLIKRKELI